MPLSFRPPQAVTLMLRILSGTPLDYDSVPAESFLVPLAIAHTDSRQAKAPHRVQSMPPERSLPAGGIFAPSDVTQPQFEAKTKTPAYISRATDTVIILNPTAGNGEAVRDCQERVESIVGGWPIRITSHAGAAKMLARGAVEEGFGRIVAAGGDGTVNQVANGIAGSNAALGILLHGHCQRFRDGTRSTRQNRSRALLGDYSDGKGASR